LDAIIDAESAESSPETASDRPMAGQVVDHVPRALPSEPTRLTICAEPVLRPASTRGALAVVTPEV
jgi:hypothetical protein